MLSLPLPMETLSPPSSWCAGAMVACVSWVRVSLMPCGAGPRDPVNARGEDEEGEEEETREE